MEKAEFTEIDIEESREIVDSISTRGHCEYSSSTVITEKVVLLYSYYLIFTIMT